MTQDEFDDWYDRAVEFKRQNLPNPYDYPQPTIRVALQMPFRLQPAYQEFLEGSETLLRPHIIEFKKVYLFSFLVWELDHV